MVEATSCWQYTLHVFYIVMGYMFSEFTNSHVVIGGLMKSTSLRSFMQCGHPELIVAHCIHICVCPLSPAGKVPKARVDDLEKEFLQAIVSATPVFH